MCYRKEEDGRITVLDEKDCQDEKPEEETDCMIQPCEGVDYITSSWSGVRDKLFLACFQGWAEASLCSINELSPREI